MAHEGFEEEEAIVDLFVDIKEDGGGGDHLAARLITEHFLPQARFIEANAWLEVINDSKLQSKLKKQVAESEESTDMPQILRIPKNKTWVNADVLNPAVKSSDQQSHYDRTLAMANIQQSMLDELDDVIECRNEWISWVAKNSYCGGLNEKGAHLNTLAMAYRDYIENILIPDKFVETENHRIVNELNKPKHPSVEAAYVNYPDTISYLKEHHPAILNDGYVMNFYCQIKIMGAEEEVLVTDNYIAFLPSKKKGWGAGDGIVINRQNINEIAVGSEYHTEYQGLLTKDSAYWTLTFETNNYQQFTRYLYLGKNESEMNQNRPKLGNTIQILGELFNVVQGDSFTSTGGYRTTFGYGWWIN